MHVRCIANNLAATAIEDVYYAELDDPVKRLNGIEIRDIVDHIKDRYCHINQADLDKNLERFNQGIDPSIPLIIYIQKQEDWQQWSQPAQSMPSNVVPSQMHGKSGTASHEPTKLG